MDEVAELHAGNQPNAPAPSRIRLLREQLAEREAERVELEKQMQAFFLRCGFLSADEVRRKHYEMQLHGLSGPELTHQWRPRLCDWTEPQNRKHRGALEWEPWVQPGYRRPLDSTEKSLLQIYAQFDLRDMGPAEWERGVGNDLPEDIDAWWNEHWTEVERDGQANTGVGVSAMA